MILKSFLLPPFNTTNQTGREYSYYSQYIFLLYVNFYKCTYIDTKSKLSANSGKLLDNLTIYH